jgi:hypothetical protein
MRIFQWYMPELIGLITMTGMILLYFLVRKPDE